MQKYIVLFAIFILRIALSGETARIDISQRGAVGDGIADDTAAIQKALNGIAEYPATLFFPRGTYLLTKTIRVSAAVAICGEGCEKTVFKLRENCSGFDDPQKPISLFLMGESTDGGSFSKCSIEIGDGNSGAIAVSVRSGRGVIEELAIRADEGSGKFGVEFTAGADWVVKKCGIEGFESGIVTDEKCRVNAADLTLEKQRGCGIFHRGKVLTVRRLVSKNDGPAIESTQEKSLLALYDVECSGGAAPACAIVCAGNIYARNVSSSGYPSALKYRGEVLDRINLGEFVGGEIDVSIQNTPSE